MGELCLGSNKDQGWKGGLPGEQQTGSVGAAPAAHELEPLKFTGNGFFKEKGPLLPGKGRRKF